MRRADAAATLGLLGVALAVFGEVLVAGGTQVLSTPGSDLETHFLSWRRFGFDELRQGNLALWNPWVFCGIPFFGGTQSALLYPPSLVHLFLPLPFAVNAGIVFHVFLTGFFTYLWVAQRGLHPAAAWFAGTTVMLSAPHVMHVYAGHLSNLSAMPWVPAALLAVDGLRNRGGLGGALFAVAAFACLLLAGHPQYALYAAFAIAIWVGVGWSRARVPARAWARLAGAAGAAGLVAAADLWAGFREAAFTTRAGGVPWEFASMFSLPPENLVTLVAPGFFGALGDPYWGRAHLWEVNVFFGVTALVLAVRGALDPDRGSRRFSGAMVVLLVVLALGANAPLYRALYEVVPGFDRFRGATKFAYLAVVFAAPLVGLGAHRLLTGGKPGGRGIATVAAAAVVTGAAALLVGSAAAGPSFGEWMEAVRAAGAARGEAFLAEAAYADPAFVQAAGDRAARALALAAATLGLVAAGLSVTRRWRPAVIALGALGLAELLVAAGPMRATFESAPPLHEVLRNVAAQDASDDRIFNTLQLNSATMTGVPDIWGFDPGVTRRYAELMTASQGGDPDEAGQTVEFRSIPPVYGMLRLRRAVVQNEGRAQLVPVAEPLPRWLLVGAYEVLPERAAALAALLDPEFDPATKVILESEPQPAPDPEPGPAEVRVLTESTDRVDFEIAVDRPSLLLVTDAYHPHWRAGPLPGSAAERYEILPANRVLRAIPLGPGEHRIRLEYRIPGLAAAATVSVAAALAWLGGLVVWTLRRRRVEAA